jgi:hypothetical protein
LHHPLSTFNRHFQEEEIGEFNREFTVSEPGERMIEDCLPSALEVNKQWHSHGQPG